MKRPADTLDIYFVDAGKGFGANATILVSPSGESAMLDAGLLSQAPNVLAVFKQAGVKQLDYLVNTHFHTDHFGGRTAAAQPKGCPDHQLHRSWRDRGVRQERRMVERAPARGAARCRQEVRRRLRDLPRDRQEPPPQRREGRRRDPHQGDRDEDHIVLLRQERSIAEPLAGAGAANPYCAEAERRGDDDAEDAQSVGVLVTYGGFKFIYLGDLSWNVELDLFCPRNRVGTVDAYLVTHHAQSFDDSRGPYWFGLSAAPKAEVHALRPRVAILSLGSNGHPRGNAKALETVLSSPGFEDLWQTDLVREGGEKDHNAKESFIANLTATPRPELQFIKLSASADGSFAVTNSRTGFTKRYPPRAQP